MLICFSFVPLIHQLETTYIQSIHNLTLKRTLFFVIKNKPSGELLRINHYDFKETSKQYCITDSKISKSFCITK
ncbi:hypothetical protein SHYC_06878 [Staphylococcus hyicus]|nr:hypothetical protein SHYC_06878 [Staphylococcus hyicus]